MDDYQELRGGNIFQFLLADKTYPMATGQISAMRLPAVAMKGVIGMSRRQQTSPSAVAMRQQNHLWRASSAATSNPGICQNPQIWSCRGGAPSGCASVSRWSASHQPAPQHRAAHPSPMTWTICLIGLDCELADMRQTSQGMMKRPVMPHVTRRQRAGEQTAQCEPRTP